MEDTRVHALDYLKVFQRRKWWFFAPVVVPTSSVRCSCSSCQGISGVRRRGGRAGGVAELVNPPRSTTRKRQRALSQQLLSAILARVAKEEGLGDSTDERQPTRCAPASTSACRSSGEYE